MKIFLIAYIIIINLLGLILMGIDKRRAIRRAWRIPERTLFAVALLFGSIGVLIGMYLFRHKTRHLTFVLLIPLILVIQLFFISFFFTWNQKRMGSPSQAVLHELELICDLDSDTIQSYISYENLTNSSIASGPIDEKTAQAVTLFFRDFTYRIRSEQTTEDTAVVTVDITNIDMHALASDLCKAILQKSVTIFPKQESPTTSDYYRLLGDMISAGSYDHVTTTACFRLKKDEKGWIILVDDTLEDELVGGFISYMNDPYILSAQTALSIHLDALKELSAGEWADYLSIEDVFSTYNANYYPQIDEAYTAQLAEYFDYEILKCSSKDGTASADIRIRSIDMSNVLTIYKKLLLDYAATTRSIRDDTASFSDETSRLLLQALSENDRSASTDIHLTFANDGSTWEVYFNEDVTDAIMGGMSEALDTFNSVTRESSAGTR